ncbi:MAG: hypothetical protein ACYSTL_01915 [Planctomycetota bacterium]
MIFISSVPFSVGALIVMVTLCGCEDLFPPAQTQPAQGQSAQKQPARAKYDDDYLAALAAADAFCDAWKNSDEFAGRALLSARMRRRYPDRQLRDAIVGSDNPAHGAYEISNGRRMRDGRYSFDVRLLYRYSGQRSERIEAPVAKIVISHEKTGEWYVDEFPVPRIVRGTRSGPLIAPDSSP